MILCDESVAKVRADEAGAASDENSHDFLREPAVENGSIVPGRRAFKTRVNCPALREP